jgi:protein O-GlcNAc transferase
LRSTKRRSEPAVQQQQQPQSNSQSQVTIEEALSRALEHHRAGRLNEAETIYRIVLGHQPDQVDALNLLGLLYVQLNRAAEAEPLLRRAIALESNFAEAHNHLGGALLQLGKMTEAMASYRRSIELSGDNPLVHANLGNALLLSGQCEAAVESFSKAIELKPDHVEALSGLAGALFKQGTKLAEAEEYLRRTLALRPDFAEAYGNLGELLSEEGRVDEAMVAYRRALDLRPGWNAMHSRLLFASLCSDKTDDAAIFEEHRRFDERYARPLARFIQPHRNERSIGRRLRIGYASPDFREHALAFFIEPILARHDAMQFEVFCYAYGRESDEVTQRLKSYGHAWRDIHSMDDEKAAELIRADGIDILVDLAAHSVGNRLLLLARKPAPVQATYLGYAGTTGLSVMDYRMTDAMVDPPGMSERFHSEKLVRLARSMWCFRPAAGSPDVGPLPCLSPGWVGFGSANALAKITDSVLSAWAEVLKQVPNSRLVLQARGLEDPTVRQRIAGALRQHGIASDRLEFSGWTDLAGYLKFLGQVDVALDAFPYAGGTTTCHALWMGAPVVTLAQTRSVSRVGASVLANIGLGELIAERVEDYIRIAVDLARDRERLATLRRGLRERMRSSPLMDEAGLVAELEKAYHEMWRQWCVQADLQKR